MPYWVANGPVLPSFVNIELNEKIIGALYVRCHVVYYNLNAYAFTTLKFKRIGVIYRLIKACI